MDVFRDSELAAQIVAWHNRHPLAMRVEAEHVRGLGSVCIPIFCDLEEAAPPPPIAPALPVSDPSAPGQGGGLRAKVNQQPQPAPDAPAADTRFRQRGFLARAAFDENFIDPLTPGAIARFAARYGAEHDPFEGAAPVRHIPPAPQLASTENGVSSRYLRTVAIELPDRRVRLLISASRWRRPVVLGPRLWSRPRCIAGATVFASLCLLTVSGIQRLSAPDPLPQPMAEAASQPASAPNSVALAATASSDPTPTPPRSSVATVVAPRVADAPADGLPAVSRPDPRNPEVDRTQAPLLDPNSIPDSSPSLTGAVASGPQAAPGQRFPVDLRPRLSSDTAREARRLSDALRESAAQAALGAADRAAPATLAEAVPSLPPASGQIARQTTPPSSQTERLPREAAVSAPAEPARSREPWPTAQQPLAKAAQGTRSYALVARQTRSRAASELLLGLMRDSEVPAGWPSTRTDVIPAANGFRAGWFPFATREEAEAARERLLRTGLPTEVIEF